MTPEEIKAKAEADAKAKVNKEKAEANKPSVKVQKRLEVIFSQNPTAKSLYKTADDFIFLEQGDATFHSKTLNDKVVSVHQRA
jgi:hypothetical protein